MKKHLPIVIVCLSLLILLFACDDKAAISQIVEYSTPTIKGTVSIPEGSSVAPEDIYVKVIDSNDKTVTIQKAKSDKTFVIQNLTEGEKYKLLFTSEEPEMTNRSLTRDGEHHEPGVGGWMHDVVPAIKEGHDIGSVKLKNLGTIKGKAIVDGASEYYDTDVYIPGTSYIAKTDKDGSFSIYNVPEGTYTLRYTHEGCVAVMTENVMLVCPDGEENPEKVVGDVKLQSNKGTVQGRAVLGDAADSTGITIKLEREDKSSSYDGSTSSDGNYVIANVAPGKYRIIASYSNYLAQTTEYFEVPAATVTTVPERIELLGDYGTLKGSVSVSDSENKEGIQILIKSTANTNSFAVLTGADGSFTKKLKPGEYTVTAYKTGYESQTEKATVVEDSVTDVPFSPLKSIYGAISGKSASAGETVVLVDSTGTAVDTIVTSDDCAYSFTNIKAGTYSVRFSKTNYASYVASDILVAADKATTVTGQTLVSSFGKINGTSNSVGETVSLLNESSSAVDSVTTGSDRKYEFSNLAVGTYALRFSKEGYSSFETISYTVSGGSSLTVNGEKLISLYGTVSGKSEGKGETVTLFNSKGTPEDTIESGEDGSYTFTRIPAGTYSVRFSKDGYVPYTVSDVLVTVGNTTTVNGETLVSLYGKISGTSYSADETVTLLRGTTAVGTAVTSSAKTYEFTEITEGTYTVRFSKEDYTDYTSPSVTVTNGSSNTVNGQKLVSIYGTVSGKSATKGETVSLVNSAGTAVDTIVTSDDCAYLFTKVAPGTYSVRFSKTGYANCDVTDVLVAADKTTTANGETLVSSFGMISGTSNSAGETVKLFSGSSVIKTLITGSDRKFEFNNLAVGTYTLSFSKEGYSSYETTSYTIKNGSNLTVNGEALVSLYGTISGKSYSVGETVYLIKESQNVQNQKTLESREYTFSKVEPGEYKVKFTKDDYSSSEVTVSVVAGQSYVVDGERLSALYGSVSGKTNSSGEFVSLVDSTGTTVKTVQVASDCSFSFSRLNPGTYSLGISKTGYSPATVDNIIVIAGENSSINTPELISTTASVTGFVALEGGVDNSGVTITITNFADKAVVYHDTSASDGSFRIADITKGGTYFITYSKDGYVSNLSNSVDVTVGKVSTLSSVTLKSVVSTVSGKIQLDGASTHENITVLLKNGTNQYNATTDQKGGYRINGVLPGTYTLMASKGGYVTASTKEFVVESSSEKEVELQTLSIAIRSITGTVKLELLTDYAGALVTATNLADSTKVYSAITNSAGQYTLAGMTPGEYQIVISYNGYRTATLPTVNVVSSTVTTIALTEMQINRGTITGVAKLEGRSSSKDIAVELLRGSDVYETTTTDESGNYSFYVPQGNYTGVRYTMMDFASSSVSKDIALFADNYFSMGNETLKATHNSVYGTVDVLTTDDESAVTISFDGVTTIQAYVTQTDGSFRFDHVPVGSYTLRFQRKDCSGITIPVEVKAADGINLGTVEVTPNTATIKGKVNLENGTSLSKVKVSVDMGGGKVLETLTDDSGRYEIGGVSIADEYTVTYSKDGWDSKTQKISPKLSILEIRELDEITLVDKIAPVISAVVINNGANTAAKRKITLNISAQDAGSGLEKIMVTHDDVFNETVRRYDYSSIFEWELPAENGTYTVYVKVVDRAGNESASYTASVTLTDQKTEVSGVLTGDKLTWIKDKSPYLVVGSVMVEEGTTLTIEPGVDVLFAGSYGITVEGTIKAIGTEDKNILFYGVEAGENNWIGINCKYDNNSMLDYIDLKGSTKGLQGYMTVLHSSLESSNYVLCDFVGELCDSIIDGAIYAKDSSLIGNTFNLCCPSNSIISGASLYDWDTYGSAYFKNGIMNSYLTGNTFEGDSLCLGGTGENNQFKNMSVATASSHTNTTFDSCDLYLESYMDFSGVEAQSSYGSSFVKCVFDDCEFLEFNPTAIRDTNFIDCDSVIQIKTKFSVYEEVDLTSNYWGNANTYELQTNGLKKEHSFIKDYYADGEFSITKANLSNFRTKSNADAGYKGDSYCSYPSVSETEYTVGQTGPAGGIVFYDKGYYSNGWRYLEAAHADVSTSTFIFGYYRATANSENRAIGTSTVIGAGRLNTEMLEKVMMDTAYNSYNDGGEFVSEYAAEKCLDYEYGGYSDWFLPSKSELNLMYTNLHKNGLGSFGNSSYWSSSENSDNNAWSQDFYDGFQGNYCRSNDYEYVRPIRAF